MESTYNPAAGLQGRKPQKPEPALTCPKCGNTWMEEKVVNQFKAEVLNLIGTKVPPIHDHVYYIYTCVSCGCAVNQPLQFFGVDVARINHEGIIDMVNKQQVESEPAKEQPVENNKQRKVPAKDK